ncbi:MAG: ATP-binding protein [Lactimicrobium sp.]|jgi:predicted AAA+ superfamily ATPase|uniref:ATP-binding protein n=1 Tax=Lactimicrobium sp. TaxID=2563780 RepID=UPI002F35EEFF
MNYIHRHIEDIVTSSEKSFKAVLVTGARQTGKSTMLKELFPDRKQITFDDEYLEDQAKQNPEMFMMLNQPPILMDEVQRVPTLFRYIKMACDKSNENGIFLLSGSQPFSLMELASESLAGRVAIIELAPLSLRETMNDPFHDPFVPTMSYVANREKTVQKPANIWEIIHRGGYPQLQDPSVDWQIYYSSYVKTYLERDVRQLSAVQDLETFRKFMVACAARTGEMLNYANIANEIGKDAATVKRWISILEASGIVYLLEPYTASVLKRAVRTPKLYFRDTGLAAYLTRWLTTDTLANGAMNGAFFETYVISEILKSYSNRGIDYRYFVSYYRGKDKSVSSESEIDLIIEENGVLHPVEIKLSSRPIAAMTSAFQILDKIPEKKRGMGAVVCLCSHPGALRDNVLALPAWYI